MTGVSYFEILVKCFSVKHLFGFVVLSFFQLFWMELDEVPLEVGGTAVFVAAHLVLNRADLASGYVLAIFEELLDG